MNKEYIKETYKNDEIELEVKIDLDYESVWLNQDDLSKLYQRSQSSIAKIISKLNSNNTSVYSKMEYTGPDGKKYSFLRVYSITYRNNHI